MFLKCKKIDILIINNLKTLKATINLSRIFINYYHLFVRRYKNFFLISDLDKFRQKDLYNLV
jgi:hypothetical protein